jgi:tRNA nucleotidyltransferase (CCA-adding enzyme)
VSDGHRGESGWPHGLRAARYAARFDFQLEPQTEALLRAADLSTVSTDRCRADLLRLAAEPNAVRGFELLVEWGLLEPRAGGLRLAGRIVNLLERQPWGGIVPRDRAILAAATEEPGSEEELAQARVERPSQAVELARGRDSVELVLARALGADWLDRYVEVWQSVRLEIDGEDLIAAGIPQGPALGRGLAEALRRKLDGEIAGREQELEVALAAAEATA